MSPWPMLWTHKAFWMTPLAIVIILLLFSAALSRGLLHRVYQRQLAESRRERLFLASIGYFIAALVVRGITFAIHNHIGPFPRRIDARQAHPSPGMGYSSALGGRLRMASPGRRWRGTLKRVGRADHVHGLWSGRRV